MGSVRPWTSPTTGLKKLGRHAAKALALAPKVRALLSDENHATASLL
jgi:hypothetical protein